jgi:regulator of protease activity HflC (stomatin/prohibitin superfamily)
MSDSSVTLLPAMLCILVSFVFLSLMMLASAIRIVPEYRRLSIFRLGRYLGEKGPGLVFLIPVIDKAIPIDTRDQVKKAQEQQNLWGSIGETLTSVHTDGSVEISGETWNAISKTPIPVGAKVRVTRVLLEIEEL